jgi:CO dehydrogenase maturation factor
MGMVLNRVRGQEKELSPYVLKTGLDLFGIIPEDDNVTRFDLRARPLLELPDDSPAYLAISDIWSRINEESTTVPTR